MGTSTCFRKRRLRAQPRTNSTLSSGPLEPHQRESEGEKIGVGESIDTNQRLPASGPPGSQPCHAEPGRQGCNHQVDHAPPRPCHQMFREEEETRATQKRAKNAVPG